MSSGLTDMVVDYRFWILYRRDGIKLGNLTDEKTSGNHTAGLLFTKK